MRDMTCVEICAGAGGQAIGLEDAGFEHVAAIEIDADACETLRLNREHWNVIEKDVHGFDGKPLRGQVTLLAGGVPCPPFSIAGKQLGADDERDGEFERGERRHQEVDRIALHLCDDERRR